MIYNVVLYSLFKLISNENIIFQIKSQCKPNCYNMFRSFFKAFAPRHLAFFGAFASLRLSPYMALSEENERINQKLKRKLNEKYHNRKDISFELTDEFRYS